MIKWRRLARLAGLGHYNSILDECRIRKGHHLLHSLYTERAIAFKIGRNFKDSVHARPPFKIRAICVYKANSVPYANPMGNYSEKVRSKDKPACSSLARVRKHRTNKMIAQAAQLREGERRCTAVKKTGIRCKSHAIKGGFVCMTHGGSAPQVRAKANKRLLALVEPALVRLGDLIEQSEHMPTALGAIRTVLERAGTVTPIGPLGKDTSEGNSRPIVNIGIAIGGLTPERLQLLAQARLPDIPAEIMEDEDEI